MKCSPAQRLASRCFSRYTSVCHLALLAAIAVMLFVSGVGILPAKASSSIPAAGERRNIVTKYGLVNRWIVKSWSDQEVVICDFYKVADGLPGIDEIRAACDTNVAKSWAATPTCKNYANEKASKQCAGLYLVHLGKREQQYKQVSMLPGAEARFSLANCANAAWCAELPRLRFYGSEPLSEERIVSINVKVGAKTTSCDQVSECVVKVPTTTDHGISLEYWVASSYGDESERHSLQVRNVYQHGSPSRYYFEVLSTAVNGDAAALQWGGFASLDHPQASFYASPGTSDSIATANHLYYLAGKLINQGKVDTSRCNGVIILLSNGNAGTCGEEAAYPTVMTWQNRYDRKILEASQTYNISPRILKGIVFQESQFWPTPDVKNEYGLGSLTDQGVDALLVTDIAAYMKVCVPALGETNCPAGYSSLTSSQRAMLRGLVLRAVGTDAEIDLVAQVLLSQVVQVGKIVGDAVENRPGQVVAYEDLWDLTIASYHAGAGCIEQGVQKIKAEEEPISFQKYCQVVPKGCQTACTFTENVKAYMR